MVFGIGVGEGMSGAALRDYAALRPPIAQVVTEFTDLRSLNCHDVLCSYSRPAHLGRVEPK